MNHLFLGSAASFFCSLTLLLGSSLSLMAAEGNTVKDPVERLKEGNQRYVSSETICHSDWTAKRASQIDTQNPFAVIVSCSDSRVPPELIFDQTLGDLFVVRIAGNVVDDLAIGSIEYAVSVLGAHLVVVLGHSNCGAVKAALAGASFDNHIEEVVEAIHPSITEVKRDSGDALEKAILANVRGVKEKLRTSKPVLSEKVEKGTLKIVGGYYHLDTGKVDFL